MAIPLLLPFTQLNRLDEQHPLQPIDPDIELLCYCVRMTVDRATEQKIQDRVNQDINWEKLLQLASRHRVLPLLFQTLNATCPESVPAEIQAELNRNFQVTALNNLLLTQELLKLLKNFDRHHIPVIPYKGVVLAASIYQNLGLRQFADIDLWAAPEDRTQVTHRLQEMGYELTKDLDWECDFTNPQTGVTIDLHWHLMPAHFHFGMTFEDVRSRLQPIQLADSAVLHFAPEDLFILLCVQFGKDCCTSQQLRLAQICDISELLNRTTHLDWDWIFNEAKSLGMERLIRLSLHVVDQLLATPLTQQVCEWRDRELHLADLTQQAIQKLWNQPPLSPEQSIGFGFWATLWSYDHRFYLRMRERVRDRVVYVQIWCSTILKLLVTPNERDYAKITLPKGFEILYSPLHIMRVMAENTPDLFKRLLKILNRSK